MRESKEVRAGARDADLLAVLSALRHRSEDYGWRLQIIEGVGDITSLGLTMRALEHQVEASAGGLEVSWPWLVELAHHIRDLIEFRLVGHPKPGTSWADVVEVELFDSSYWKVMGDDALLVELEATSSGGWMTWHAG